MVLTWHFSGVVNSALVGYIVTIISALSQSIGEVIIITQRRIVMEIISGVPASIYMSIATSNLPCK
jgi:hypothetical protein